jgi:asparaginyl-tRNA synthetase
MSYTPIIRIDESCIGKEITLSGWITTIRFSKKIIFIKLADSWKSRLMPFQIIFDIKEGITDELLKLGTGDSIAITGSIVKSPKAEQPYEMVGKEFIILGRVNDPASYPMAKTDLSLEHFRSYPHLECFSATKSAIYGIRSLLMEFTETFFKKEYFTKVDMPLITFSECEGGCQPMQATLLLSSGKINDIPIDSKLVEQIDFSKDFFGVKASLTVSSQLELETQLPLGRVWTVTRAIRGEPSMTTRHLCEFSMIEIEMPFIKSAKDVMEMSEKYIQCCITAILHDEWALKALELLEKKFAKPLRELLIKYTSKPFDKITHYDAVTLLRQKATLNEVTFTSLPEYDEDMGSEHERYLTDTYFQHPVIVTRYPKKVKAFYMPVIDTEGGIEHVDCFDILVPSVGELVGGSARINNATILEERIKELGLDIKPLQFYVDLRKNGSIPHGGMGMGFERLIKWITGADTVRDVVSFPRFYKSGMRSDGMRSDGMRSDGMRSDKASHNDVK